MSETVFGKILRGEIPADTVYQDDDVTAFRDINPQAPTHILVIPNRAIPNLAATGEADQAILGKLLVAAALVARQEGIDSDGYRVVINVGRQGGESVPHLHLHVLGGRQLGWPPG